MQVRGVEDQGVVADGNDEPAEFGHTVSDLERSCWGGWQSGRATTHQRSEVSRVTLKVLQLRRMIRMLYFFSFWDKASST